MPISIHAPRVGRDAYSPAEYAEAWEISIHAPRVGRDNKTVTRWLDRDISIHAPRVGRDFTQSYHGYSIRLFQSTRPVWGATAGIGDSVRALSYISIHAPRVGRDLP